MSKQIVTILTVVVACAVLITGCDLLLYKDEWRAYIYVGVSRKEVIKGGPFAGKYECFEWAHANRKTKSDGIECGRNCMDVEQGVICDETHSENM